MMKTNLTLSVEKETLDKVRDIYPTINFSKFMTFQLKSLILNEEFYLELK